jgi:hypothetical protein
MRSSPGSGAGEPLSSPGSWRSRPPSTPPSARLSASVPRSPGTSTGWTHPAGARARGPVAPRARHRPRGSGAADRRGAGADRSPPPHGRLPDEVRRLIDEGALSLEYAADHANSPTEVLDQALADIADGHHPRAAIDRAPEKVRRHRIESGARASWSASASASSSRPPAATSPPRAPPARSAAGRGRCTSRSRAAPQGAVDQLASAAKTGRTRARGDVAPGGDG